MTFYGRNLQDLSTPPSLIPWTFQGLVNLDLHSKGRYKPGNVLSLFKTALEGPEVTQNGPFN